MNLLTEKWILAVILFLCISSPGQLETLFSEDPENRGSATLVRTVNDDGSESSVNGGNSGVPTTGSLASATGSLFPAIH